MNRHAKVPRTTNKKGHIPQRLCTAHGAKRPQESSKQAFCAKYPHPPASWYMRGMTRKHPQLVRVSVSSAVGGSKVVPGDLILLHKGEDQLVLPGAQRDAESRRRHQFASGDKGRGRMAICFPDSLKEDYYVDHGLSFFPPRYNL